MEQVQLKYGEKMITFPVKEAKSVEYLLPNKMYEITDLKQHFLKAITTESIGAPALCDLLSKNDKVTIVISDMTRYWTRQDLILDFLLPYLKEEIGIPFENITILIALGTHRPASEEELKKLAGEFAYERVKVVNHDCDATDQVLIGTTSFGTEVRVNRLATESKVILIGGTVHHMMAGFGGGRKSVLPGISARETIRQNHCRALDPREPHSDLRVGTAKLSMNPIHEDMDEAAELLNPIYGINLVVNTSSKHSGIFCGHWREAWLASCDYVQKCYELPIQKEADIVIVSCGGYPKDINLYQSTKSLFHATFAVKQGGTLIFLAECREGGGAKDFFDWIVPLKEGHLDEALRANFTIGGYIFYAACEKLQKAHTFMLSEIPNETVKEMGITSFSNIEELMETIDFNGKDVYIIPNGGAVVPVLSAK